MARHHGDAEQRDHGYDVVRVLDAKSEVGRGEEEIIGERGSQGGKQRGAEAGQHGGGEHGGQIEEIDRGVSPPRRNGEPRERRGGDHQRRLAIAAKLRGGGTVADGQTGHAAYLRQFPDARVRLEGNTDERGSREYNLGLGERRGNAVQSALSAAGASSSQLNVVSYGEERPVCRQHDEACWSKNRRVEIVYTAK